MQSYDREGGRMQHFTIARSVLWVVKHLFQVHYNLWNIIKQGLHVAVCAVDNSGRNNDKDSMPWMTWHTGNPEGVGLQPISWWCSILNAWLNHAGFAPSLQLPVIVVMRDVESQLLPDVGATVTCKVASADLPNNFIVIFNPGISVKKIKGNTNR